MRFKYHTNWHSSYLGEIVDYCGGGTPSTKNKSYWNGNIPWISSSDLYEDDIYKINKTRFITEQAIQNSATKLCPKESICIVSRVGVGKVAVTQQELCTSQDFFNIIKCNINKYFFAYQIQQKIKIAQQQGTSIKGITSKEIQNFKIWIPSENEQDKISFFLKLIDKRIQTQIKIIELKKSIIKKIEETIFWCSSINNLVPVSLFLDEINEKSQIQNLYPILSSTKKGLFLQSEYFNKEAASSNNIGYKIVHKENVIISPQNLWMGNITYNNKFENGLVSPSYRVFKIKGQYNPIYVSHLLMTYRAVSMYKTISEQGASIVRRNLNIDAFNELLFPLPNRKKQDEVSCLIGKLHQDLVNEQQILNLLNKQKKFLLANMFI